jgi:hypothetical protein
LLFAKNLTAFEDNNVLWSSLNNFQMPGNTDSHKCLARLKSTKLNCTKAEHQLNIEILANGHNSEELHSSEMEIYKKMNI